MFERRHYKKLAEFWKSGTTFDVDYDGDASLIFYQFREMLKEDNPNFDDAKFCEAVGYRGRDITHD